MFGRKKCKKCKEKISSKYGYCPTCGTPVNEEDYEENYYDEDEDWGMLGKDDSFEDAEIRLPFGFNTLFNSLISSLDKQFREFDKELGKNKFSNQNITPDNRFAKSGGIRINISSSGNKAPKIMVRSFGNIPEFKDEEREIKKQAKMQQEQKEFSKENIKKLSTLPRKEPSTNIRRLSNKVVYEIDLPGVKSEKDISIIQLENSIEIKAVGKDSAYFKLIPINLPIKGHKLSDGKLVLELEAGN